MTTVPIENYDSQKPSLAGPTLETTALAMHVSEWASNKIFNPSEVDCATAVMLKIIDGKCKMPAHEKVIMAQLYQVLKSRPYHHLGDQYHQLIKTADADLTPALIETIYETRVLAETQISRPVMKAFKKRLRLERLLPTRSDSGDNSMANSTNEQEADDE